MLIYDIFENITQYLSICEIVDFLLASKSNYTMYLENKHYCDIILNRKIFEFLDIQITSTDVVASDKTKNIFRIYNYFRNHCKSLKPDYLVYMIDNEVDDPDLFRLFASQCNAFRNMIDSDDIRSVNYTGTVVINKNEYSLISFNDMKYMLIHSNKTQLDILLETYNIPVCLLSYATNEILISDKKCKKNVILRRFIKYMFVKHCLGNFVSTDNTYVHSVLLMLIKYKRTDVFKYFLDKKRKYMMIGEGLEYQYLVNKCVEMQNRIHLLLLLQENKNDNNIGLLTKNYVIINTHNVIEHCKNARFDYIAFLVEHCLGRAINTSLYIESICQGVESLIVSKNIIGLHRLNILKEYISDNNREFINNHINSIYDSFYISYDKRFYL